jgi:hypothetical protein
MPKINHRKNIPTLPDKEHAARAWAEFLYSEYCLEKSLRDQPKGPIIKDATNHDKPNS